MSFAKEVKSAMHGYMHGHERNVPRRPGISVVRPKLHEDNQENRELFSRWVRLHMRDILSLPEDKDLGSPRKVLRYTRMNEHGGEEYFHTIVLDDVRIPATNAFQGVSHRLDLENTRELRDNEEPVLRAGDKKMGSEPMARSIFKPAVGLFEEMRNVDLDRAQDMCGSYQDFPMEPGKLEEATSYKLITLTIAARGLTSTPSRNVCMMHASLVSFLGTATQKKLCTSLYSRNAGVQPQGTPKIEDGEHGGGDWLAVILIPGNADERLMHAGLPGVEGQLDEWSKRVMLEGSLEGVEIKTAVWTGDIFMS